MADFACYLSEGRLPYLCMTYRLNTDRLVLFSVLLWGLLPPGLFAWGSNPPTPDNVRWLDQFCSSYVEFLTMGGILGIIIGFVCAVLIWLVHRLTWARSVKIAVLFLLSAVILILYGGSLSFGEVPDLTGLPGVQREQGGMTGKKGRIGCPYFSACLPPEE